MLNSAVYKLILILICILFIQTQSVFCQKIFDIEADYISINHDEINFFKKSELKEGALRKIDFEFEKLYDYEHTLNLSSKYFYEFAELDSLIPVENLFNVDKNTFEDKLQKQYFILQENSDLWLLDKFNAYFFTIRRFSSDSILKSTDYYQYCFIRINNEKLVLLFTETATENPGIVGSILPLNSGFEVIFENIEFEQQNYDFFNTKIKEQLEKYYAYDDPDFEENRRPWQEVIYEIDSENRLREFIFGQDVLGISFDTLYIQRGFIIGEIDKKYHIYNLKLEKLSPENTIGVFPNRLFVNEYCQIITPKTTKWIYKNKEVLDSLKPEQHVVCGTVSSFDYLIEKNNQQFILLDRRDESWFEEGYENILSNPLFTSDEYDKVTFLNGKTALTYDGNSGTGSIYDFSNNQFHFLLLQKDDKYGIIEFIRNKDNSLNFKTHLQVLYDEIQFLGYHIPIKFKKNGLYGYYPLNQEEKYKVLEDFNGYFARFKLSKGKKGWLGLDGKEYFKK